MNISFDDLMIDEDIEQKVINCILAIAVYTIVSSLLTKLMDKLLIF